MGLVHRSTGRVLLLAFPNQKDASALAITRIIFQYLSLVHNMTLARASRRERRERRRRKLVFPFTILAFARVGGVVEGVSEGGPLYEPRPWRSKISASSASHAQRKR